MSTDGSDEMPAALPRRRQRPLPRTDGSDEMPAARKRRPLPREPQDFGDSVEDTGSEVVSDYVPRGKVTDNTRRYLTNLVEGSGGRFPDLDDDEMVAVEDAFRNLQSRLGSAGKTCIQAYRRWGERFWQSSERDVWQGLIMSYWHQVMLAVGVRRRAIGRLNDTLKDVPYEPLLPTMISLPSYNFDTAAVPDDKIIRPALRTEYGHFRSINRRIRQDAQLTCEDGSTYFIVPCAIYQSPDYDAWIRLVDDTEAVRLLKKNRTTVEAVEKLFAEFLRNPNMVQWNNLISAALLARLHIEWINESAASLAGWDGTINFANRATEQLYEQLSNFGYAPPNEPFFVQPLDSSTWFPVGYRGMVRLFLGNERLWEYINVVDKAGRIIPLDELDQDPDDLYDGVKKAAINVLSNNDPQDRSEQVDADDAVVRATEKALKKAKSKRGKRAPVVPSPPQQNESIEFVAPLYGGRRPSEITARATAQELVNIGAAINSQLEVLEATDDYTQGGTKAIRAIFDTFAQQPFLAQLSATYCAVSRFLDRGNQNDETFQSVKDEIATLREVTYGIVDEDEIMPDAPDNVERGGDFPAAQPASGPDGKGMRKTYRFVNRGQPPAGEAPEPPPKRQTAGSAMRVENDACTVQ